MASTASSAATFRGLLLELELCHHRELARAEASGGASQQELIDRNTSKVSQINETSGATSTDGWSRCEQMLGLILQKLDSAEVGADTTEENAQGAQREIVAERDPGSEEEVVEGVEDQMESKRRSSYHEVFSARRKSASSPDPPQTLPLRTLWTESIDKGARRVTSAPTLRYSNTMGSDDDELIVQGALKSVLTQPSSSRSLAVDLLGGFLILYDMCFMPLRVFDPLETPFTEFMDWFSLVFWTLNVAASLTTGYFDEGLLVMDFRKICWKYCKTWFILDLVTLGPDWVSIIISPFVSDDVQVLEANPALRILRLLRLMRMIRVLKLKKTKRFIESIIDYFDSEYVAVIMNVIKMFVALVFVTHFLACAWWAVGSIYKDDPFVDSWIRAGGFDSSPWPSQYSVTFHWAITQFTPASMTVQPTNAEERAFAISVIVLGLLVFSWIVGSITGNLAQLRSMSEQQSKDFWFLRRFLRQHAFPSSLSLRVLRFLEHTYSSMHQTTTISQVKVLGMLSKQLMDELHCELNLPALIIHPLFEYMNDVSRITTQKLAKDAVINKPLAAGDTLFQNHEVGAAMYFVSKGRIKYTRQLVGKAKSEFVDANEDWISEHVLWTPRWLHVGQAVARQNCEVLAVSPNKFGETCAGVETVALMAARYGSRFLEWMAERLAINDLTDVIQGDLESDSIKACIVDEEDVGSSFPDELEQTTDGDQVAVTDDKESPRKGDEDHILYNAGSFPDELKQTADGNKVSVTNEENSRNGDEEHLLHNEPASDRATEFEVDSQFSEVRQLM